VIGSWDRRIRRAQQLADENGSAASLLTFYVRLLRQQKVVYDSFNTRLPSVSFERDVSLIAASGSALLHEVANHGPHQLVAESRTLLECGDSAREDLLLTYWRDRSDRQFFAKALLQPYGQWVADAGLGPIDRAGPPHENRCPRCGGAPQLSILETAGIASDDGGSRQLLCATCLIAWSFRRVVCPYCGEEDERKLGYFQTPEFDHVRVNVCDSCRHYVKTIDLGRLGVAVPLVDEIAGAPLDVWAHDNGYEKIELNLVGL
jgi:FdhE protein